MERDTGLSYAALGAAADRRGSATLIIGGQKKWSVASPFSPRRKRYAFSYLKPAPHIKKPLAGLLLFMERETP